MYGLIINNAIAQEAQNPANAQSPIMSMIPLVLVFLVFYFLMIRPHKKKLEQEQEYIKSLQKGDEVYTKAGILGTIYGITDKVVTLEVEDGAKIKVLKTHIGGASKPLFETQPAKK